jgi:hypothetical protein
MHVEAQQMHIDSLMVVYVMDHDFVFGRLREQGTCFARSTLLAASRASVLFSGTLP